MILAIFGGLFMISCERVSEVPVSEPVQDNDTYSVMKDITGTFGVSDKYAINQDITIQNTDVVVVYRNVNSNSNNNTPSWQLLPKTYYLTTDNRELDYNFVFNTQSVKITTEANFDQSTMTPQEKATYLNNQTFRIVLVPASKANRTSAKVDYEDYNAVVKYYNLKEPK